MGGKTKQAQRTKNNVRPSSSGRSAELLSSGGLSPGSTLPGLFPTLAAAAPAPDLNADLAMVVKKLNKKDPITKTKALQELNELIKSSKPDEVVALLPNWTHYYKTLSLDPDRKVREVTQLCHGSIAGVCGRQLAPYLKALLPTWLQAQYDDHGPAQARAQLSLNATFPENKLPEAISFCKAEVMTYLIDNLLNAEAAVSKKLESSEERAAAAARVAAGSLQGLRAVCERLPAALSTWLWAELASLLASPAFWKLAHHSVYHVRSAWYSAIGGLAARFGDLFSGAHGGRALKALVAAPAEPPAPALWTALGHILAGDPECPRRVEKTELLEKRLLETVAGGGWGDARQLRLTLLPLLARLSHMLSGSFYERFFDACFKGLNNRRVSSSRSERHAWAGGVTECILWVSTRAGGPEAALRAHRAWLIAVGGAAHAVVRNDARLMAELLKAWLRAGAELMLVRGFWLNVTAAVDAQLQALPRPPPTADVTALLDGHVLLLRTLRPALAQEPKRQQSIKFEDETEPSDAPGSKDADAAQVEPLPARLYAAELARTEQRLCALYVRFAEETRLVDCVLAGLMPLLDDVDAEDCKQRLEAMSREMGGDSIAALYRRAVRPWLEGGATRGPHALRLAFLLLPHLAAADRDTLLADIGQLSEEVVEWAVGVASSHPARGLEAVRRWLHAAAPGRALVRCANRALQGDSKARSLLMACLTPECIVGPDTAAEVVTTIAEGLKSERSASAAALAAELATALPPTMPAVPTAPTAPAAAHAALTAALFDYALRCQATDGDEAEAARDVRSAIQDSLAAAPTEPTAPTAPTAAVSATVLELVRLLHQYLDTESTEIDTERISRAGAMCPYLISAERSPDEVAELARLVLPPMEECRASVLPYALRRDIISGRLSCPLVDVEIIKNDETELSSAAFAKFARACLLRAEFVRAMVTDADADADRNVLDHPELVTLCAELMHDAALLRSLRDGFAFWAHYDNIVDTESKMSALVEASELGAARRHVLASLARHAAERGHYWALAAAQRRDQLSLAADLADTVSGDGFFHGLQAQAELEPELSLEAAFLCCERALLCAGADLTPVGGPREGKSSSEAGRACVESVAGPSSETTGGPCVAGPSEPVAGPSEPVAGPSSEPVAGPSSAPDNTETAVESSEEDSTGASLEAAVNAHYRHPELMLHDTDLSSAEWARCAAAAQTLALAELLLARRGWLLPAHHWDFITISCVSLLASLDKSRHCWSHTKTALAGRAAVRLHRAVARWVRGVAAEGARRRPAPHVAAAPREWADVFQPDATSHLYTVILHVLENDSLKAEEVTSARSLLLGELTRTSAELAEGAVDDQRAVRLLSASGAALAGRGHPGYKYLAYHAALALVPALVTHDVGVLKSEAEGALSLCRLEAPLRALADAVTDALDRRDLDPRAWTPTYAQELEARALGWLLAAEVVAALLERAAASRAGLELRYVEELRAFCYFENLVPAALRLMPGAVSAWAADPAISAPPPARYHTHFTDQPSFLDDAPHCCSEQAARLACRGVLAALRGGGAGCVRGWWAAADTRVARAFDRLVAAYVSPALCRAALQAVLAAPPADAAVRVHRSAGEVAARTVVDERSVELSIVLSRSHPLVPPRVASSGGAVGAVAGDAGWVAALLAHRNGSLAEAVRLWARAVAARVEAAPVCYICYCRLHPVTARLPSETCRQCHNTFHTQCLQKWFTSSNKSDCPLCRASF